MKRIFYVLLVIWELLFIILYYNQSTALLLLFTVLLGFTAELSLAIVKRKLQVRMVQKSVIVTKNEPFVLAIYITNHSHRFVISDGSFVCRYQNVTTGEECSRVEHFSVGKRETTRILLRFQPLHYGKIEVTIEKAVLNSVFHLFSRKVSLATTKKKKHQFVAIMMPGEQEIEDNSDWDNYLEEENSQYYRSKKGDDNSEILEIRDYHAGDRLNRIHWKVTYKNNELAVKDYSLPEQMKPGLWLDLSEVSERQEESSWQKRDYLFERLVYNSHQLLADGYAHKIGYFDPNSGKVCWKEVQTDDDLCLEMLHVYETLPYKGVAKQTEEFVWEETTEKLSSCKVFCYSDYVVLEWEKAYQARYQLACDVWKLQEMWINLLLPAAGWWKEEAHLDTEKEIHITTAFVPKISKRHLEEENNHVSTEINYKRYNRPSITKIRCLVEGISTQLLLLVSFIVAFMAAIQCIATSISIPLSLFKLGVNLAPCIIVTMIGARLVIHKGLRYMWINLLSYGYIAYYFVNNWEVIKNGCLRVVNLFLARWNYYFDTNEGFYRIAQVSDTEANQQILIFFTAVLLVVGVLAAQALFFQFSLIIYLLLTMPVAFFSFVVGVVPGEIEFGIYLVSTLVLLSWMRVSRRRRRQSLAVMTLTRQMTLMLTVCFLLVVLIVPSKVFTETKTQKKYKESLSQSIERLTSIDLFPSYGWFSWMGIGSQGIDYGSLQQNNRNSSSNRLVLKATTSSKIETNLYLKGYSGDYLSSDGWKSMQSISTFANEYKYLLDNDTNPENVPSSYISEETQTMRIQNIRGGKGNFFAPVGTKTPIILNERGVVTFAGKDSRDYQVNYYPSLSKELDYFVENWSKSSALANFGALSYRGDYMTGFAQMYYLQTPSDLALLSNENLGIFFRDYVKDVGENLSEYIRAISGYLQDSAVYDLNPPKVPSDQNFIDYFLYTSHKGYCLHFASAAVMLFRVLGIPARLAEGYMVKESDIRKAYSERDQKSGEYTISVQQKDAHAWPEIYLQDYGWVPVEVTPGMQEEKAEATKEPKATATPQQATSTPSIQPTSPSMATSTPMTNSVTKTTKKTNKPYIEGIGYGLMTVLLLFGIYVSLRLLVRKKQRREWLQANTAQRILLLYEWRLPILRVCKDTWEVPITDQADRWQKRYPDVTDWLKFLTLLQEAYFSEHEMEPEKLDYVREVLESYQIKAKLLAKWWKKLYIIVKIKFIFY